MHSEDGAKKRVIGSANCCAGGFRGDSAQLPTLQAVVNGKQARALLDSGCSTSIISKRIVQNCDLRHSKRQITMMNGKTTDACWEYDCCIQVLGRVVTLSCFVCDILPGYDLLLGMDAVSALGGVSISGDRRTVTVKPNDFCGAALSAEELIIKDKDFEAKFENGRWVAAWKWTESCNPILSNRVSQYSMKEEIRPAFNAEIQEWIKLGWLQEYEGEHEGLIPLMAVEQINKGKIRPVLDFRELNNYVSSHTAESAVCGEKLRRWRQLGTSVSVLDLSKAYLQVHIRPDLWKYQVVGFQGKQYCLTRLGFGLNVAPKIMSAIVTKVLSLDPNIERATDSFIDDIIVNESIISANEVSQHLQRYGLESKPSECLIGARVLGLRVFEENGEISWKRDNLVEAPRKTMTKREIFSLCGRLLGHFPVAAWLRPACSYLKRKASAVAWDSPVSNEIMSVTEDLWEKFKANDPVKGNWHVPDSSSVRVFCDASSIAIGVCVEVSGRVVEDASWLRKADDAAHINLAELEAVLKGVDLASKWEAKEIEIITDSAAVHSWLKSIVSKDKKIQYRGMGEILLRRRLGLLDNIVKECGIVLTSRLVPSAENKADALTRVPKSWLNSHVCAAAVEEKESVEIRRIHDIIHCGVDKTYFLVKSFNPNMNIEMDKIKEVVQSCVRCRSIDPTPVRWEGGCLSVDENWSRIACDVTHYKSELFLTLVDSGPSRFAAWKKISNESAREICGAFKRFFQEMGPPGELLLDNSTTFKSGPLRELCDNWGVRMIYRAAYRPRGNGIVERNHRTIKRMAARTEGDILDAVFWYNFLPREGIDQNTSPSRRLFLHSWRNPKVQQPHTREKSCSFERGDAVFVKPPGARCTTQWKRGYVTNVTPEGAVDVDGVHRHIADIRHVSLDSVEGYSSDENSEVEVEEREGIRRSERVTAQPWRYADADYNS